MARAKRVSKAFGTKIPAKTTRNLPSKGRRATSETTAAMTAKTTGVQKLSGEAWKYVGRPGFKGKIPGPVDGKDNVTRKMVTAPTKGITTPQAAKITSAHVDLIGGQNPARVIQPLPNTPQPYDTARKSVATPRKGSPVYSNTPGKVRRSMGQP